MKAVLISIQPKWCELIASGEKTVEVRKNIPKLSIPFKCYIYETQGRKFPFSVKIETVAKYDDERFLDARRGMPAIKKDKNGKPYFSYGRMKVIGEFICDEITYFENISTDEWAYLSGDVHERHKDLITNKACLTEKELHAYGGKYAWNISNLKIYDKPLEISEFCSLNGKHIVRPPQSWMYVESIKSK